MTHTKPKQGLLAGMAACFLTLTPAALADATDAASAAQSTVCEDIQPFYWEIGDDDEVLASGQVGGTEYARATTVNLASGSKWVTSAYVLERYPDLLNGTPSTTEQEMIDALRMMRGHVFFNDENCVSLSDVEACHTYWLNDAVNSNRIGYFNYNGGDVQWIADSTSHLDIGNFTLSGLASEVDYYLDLGSSFDVDWVALASGYRMSAADYAEFLRKLMTEEYVLGEYLGHGAVDTQCGWWCTSPIGDVDMEYSLYHWVENQSADQELQNGKTLPAGDGSFSSAGAFGFYPWISSDKSHYGIVSTEGEAGTSADSLVCGIAIRQAFFE